MAGSISDPSLARSPSVASPRLPRSRTQSISSDRPSTIGQSLISPPATVSPEAAFIASSAASQIVTNDHDSHADTWYDDPGLLAAGETALITPSALQLVNNFLDQLLFNFLQISKATTLSALRPAVTEVLKPKLAKDAINNADEELREYLGGGDEDDFVQPRGADPGRDWDLELVWKRTRLRCMVYSSLGDMEEEEEDTYMEQEHLELGDDEQISDVISPAVAIFLTSVLEYMGELTLTVAGQAAYFRMRSTYEKELKQGTRHPDDIADRIVVGETDMERVALDRTLGRLWRGWKKRIRAPQAVELGGRPFSRQSVGHLRSGSNFTEALGTPRLAPSDAGSEAHHEADESLAKDAEGDATEKTGEEGDAPTEPREPTEVPLPMGENDIDEIEVPGLAYNSDDEEEDDEDAAAPRPKSFLLPANILSLEALKAAGSRAVRHVRSSSAPLSKASRFILPEAEAEVSAEVPETPASDEEKEVFEEAVTEQPGEENEKSEDAKTADKARPASVAIQTTPADDGTAIGVARTTDERIRDSSSDGEHIGTYEKAEIVTSSRVSVASSSPSTSEVDAKKKKKSNSVSSARIIDVAGPKGSGSRSPSMDVTDRSHGRSPSLSRASQTSSPTATESAQRQKDDTSRHAAATSPLRSSVDRPRHSHQKAAPISESEEEDDDKSSGVDAAAAAAAISAASTIYDAPYGEKAPVPVAPRSSSMLQPPQKSSPSRQQGASNTKVTILNTSNSSGPFIEETIPEVPARAPGRHSVKPDTTPNKPRESEDTALFPIQSNASQRQTHTSGSSGSSATGRLKAVRTSEEHVPSHAENVARNFEELIQSNQTITYTLTPENMRDMDSPRSVDSPVFARFKDAKPGDRSRSSSTATDAKTTPASRMAAVVSQSPEGKGHKPSPIAIPGPNMSKSTSLKSPLKPAGLGPQPPLSPGGPKSPRVPASLARDARVPTDSTADFAEFIKSTGPPGDKKPPPIRNTNNASISTKNSIDSRRVSQASNRNRYQPREAVAEGKGDNSDLIDFIRQGPPGPAPNHRIPRHVAPFRTTGDSEHMSAAAGGLAVDATIPEVRNSQASTSVTDNSTQSTINSSAALIKNKAPTAQQSNMFDGDDMMPKRKQRRVRDPYAIDFSDEEDDDDLLMTPQPPVKKEESLAEFLRNYEPPPEPQQPPVSQKMPKKKSSAPSLMGRFSRVGFGREPKDAKDINGTNGTNGKQTIEARSLNSRTGLSSPTNSSVPRSGHIPLQVNMPTGYDKYGSVESNTSKPRSAGPPSTGRVPMKKFEPRDATPGLSRTGTADLAAFLRDSEPPPSAMATPPLASPTEESSGFSKMFARRKKGIF